MNVARWNRRHWLQGTAALLLADPGRAAEPGAAPLPALGSVLPLAPASLLDGGRFEPREAEGRVLVLYWWASWCPFCAEQSPEMQKLWDAGRARGLRLLALSIDRRPDEAVAYLRRKGYTFPAAWLGPELARAYPKPEGLPVTVVRGKDGRVLQAEQGQMFPEDVAELARWL
ncbi:MAG TPA: TlpA disulfide reductase family protein [Ottowia sp.]|uniref:TlpA family protein disulfide reductase n=1 Tax=Ottowia sp. TaxID=1898956 RepID=UPI002CFC0CAA|nr:TlpA disulfide reductase family protein [Ottowia sp.]HMN20660.1 TlpA disulfide reductase family protein [Ottowia sp.]